MMRKNVLSMLKIAGFAASFAIACLIFSGGHFSPVYEFFHSLGWFGAFIAGALYVFGATSMPATAVLLVMAEGLGFWPALIFSSLGALSSDIVLLAFFRNFFKREIKIASKAAGIEKRGVFARVKRAALLFIGAIFVASPLPTEIGISIISLVKEVDSKKFAILACLLHTAAIAIILTIGLNL